MRITSAVFKTSAQDLAGCPVSAMPEFAFIGRSNVGKSSLINMLTGHRSLAKVSETPGKTKLMNFFTINHAWTLVDLPGYGYAKVSKGDRARFSESAADYLVNRPNLVNLFVLIDSRLAPQEIDVDFLDWAAGCNLPVALVMTKNDKKSRESAAGRTAALTAPFVSREMPKPLLFNTSSTSGLGRRELLAFIEQRLAEEAS
jgi:GTP-binding protein